MSERAASAESGSRGSEDSRARATEMNLSAVPILLRVRTRATAILTAMALLPAALIAWWMADLYRGAVETTEKQLQSSVLAELTRALLTQVDDVQNDVDAVAAALAFAADDGAQDALSAVEAVLATRKHVRAVRFVVPKARVSTVLRHRHAPQAGVPEVSEALRQEAQARGRAFAAVGLDEGLVVVPVPAVVADAPRGFLAAAVDLSRLSSHVREVAETRFDKAGVRLLLADASRRVVAAHGPGLLSGSDARALPISDLLPEDAPMSRRVGVVSEFEHEGERFVGAIETVPELGWVVASWRPRDEAYSSLTALGPRFFGAAMGVLLLSLVVGFFVARAVSRPVASLMRQARLIGQRRWDDLSFGVEGGGEFAQLSASLEQMATELREGEAQIAREARLRGDLSRFMSQELVSAIIRGEHSLELGGKRAEVTVLFADVVAFTPLAEGHSPERVVGLLNDLFSMLSEVVFRYRGTVDKFIGDCLMAVWGAPEEQADHASLALDAALDMMSFLETANEGWKAEYGVELRLAVGINSGEVIVGNIGSKKRMEYTVIGDAVNVAARLEAIAKPNQVLLTASTHASSDKRFEVASLGAHRLTGRAKSTEVYELAQT